MAAVSIVPRGITLENLPPLKTAVLKAQKTIEDRIPLSGLDDYKRFEYFTDIATKAPFLVLDRSRCDERNWHQSDIDVETALKSILPTSVFETLKQNKDFPAIQELVEGTVKMDKFSDFVFIDESGDRCIVEFAILRTANLDECKLEVYYVKLTASFSAHGMLGMYKTSRDMSAKYCFNEYTVLTHVLLSVKPNDQKKERQEMQKWYDMTEKR